MCTARFHPSEILGNAASLTVRADGPECAREGREQGRTQGMGVGGVDTPKWRSKDGVLGGLQDCRIRTGLGLEDLRAELFQP